LKLGINFFIEDIRFKFKGSRKIKEWIKEVIYSEGKDLGDINYIFTSDKYLLKINKEYLNHNYFTDIITFNYNEGNSIDGEIYISIDRVQENSIEYSDSFWKEFFRVMVHGILHLLGYDDGNEKVEKVMRKKEDFYLKILYTEILQSEK